MANGNIFGPQFQAEQSGIDRRRRIAEMLMQQAFQPRQGQQAGRLFVPPSPLSLVASGLQAYKGGQGMTKADEEEQALAERFQSQQSDEMRKVTEALIGQQAIPQPPAELGGGPGRPEIPSDPRQALVQAMQAQSPAVRGMAPQLFNSVKAAEERVARMEQKAMELEARSEDRALDRASREQMAKDANALRLQIAQLTKAAGGRSPYFTPVYTPEGVVSFNTREGTGAPLLVGGKPAVRSADDPALQGTLAGAKAAGKTSGEAQATATINLPQAVADAEQSKQLIDQMIGSQDGKVKPHPGFESYVGATMKPYARLVEGSSEAGFEALLNQVKGGAFLEAFNKLKGGGHITEIEGQKGVEAITRMSKSQNEAEFIKAAREYQQVIDAGVKRARQKAAGGDAAPAAGQWAIKPLP